MGKPHVFHFDENGITWDALLRKPVHRNSIWASVDDAERKRIRNWLDRTAREGRSFENTILATITGSSGGGGSSRPGASNVHNGRKIA